VPPLRTDVKPPAAPRVGAGLIQCAGDLWSVGGQRASATPGVEGGAPRTFLRSLSQYSSLARSWVSRAEMHVARSHPNLACVRNSTLLVAGGYGALGEPPYAYQGPLTSSEEYDPVADRWYVREDAPSARYYGATASEPSGHVYVAGGWGTRLGLAREAYGTEGVLSAFERYEATLSRPRSHPPARGPILPPEVPSSRPRSHPPARGPILPPPQPFACRTPGRRYDPPAPHRVYVLSPSIPLALAHARPQVRPALWRVGAQGGDALPRVR
jgi:hypothetical protein